MKYFKLKFLTFFLTALLAFGVGWAAEETVTYTFTSKSWKATPENWTGSSDGNQFNSNQSPYGVQITKSVSGLTVTSPKSYNNISKIVITYSSTKNAVGTIYVYVGDELIGYQSVEKNKTTTPLTYTVSNKSGIVKFKNYCTTNSYGINSIAITYETGGSTTEKVATPTFSVASGTYTTAQSVEISCATASATIYYTLDGTDPTTESTPYTGAAISISETTTLKAIAIKDGMENSAIATATYTFPTVVTNLAEAKKLTPGTNFVYNGYAVVTYAYDSQQYSNADVWIRDDQGNAAYLFRAVPLGFKNGDLLKTGWTATKDVYKGLDELKNVTMEKDGTAEAKPITIPGVTNDDVNQFVRLEKISSISDADWYDKFSTELTLDPSKQYNVEGIVGYKDGLEFYPISVEEVDAPAPDLAIALDPAEKSATAGENIEVAVTANTDAEVIYVYTCNPATATLTETETGFTITSATAGTVTVTVNAMDEDYREATATGTYTFTAAPEPGVKTTYKKVTSTDDITDGKYLIVYEDSSVAFDGSRETLDAVNNIVEVTITDGEIETDKDIYFTYDATAQTLKSASGFYIGQTKYDNGLATDQTTQYTNSIAIDESANAVITAQFADGSSYPTLRYNSASNQSRFRYYKSGQKAIQLYKEVTGDEPVVPELSVALDPAEKTYTVGDVAKIMVTVENGNDDTPVSYKINDGEDQDYNAETGIVLPNDKAKEYTVEVYATDGDREATATGTYTFTAAPAFEITLTPNQEGNYTVGDNAVVTVAVDKYLVEDYLVTYTIGDSEEQIDYNAKTGIVLPNDKAGDVTVKVYVTDGYDHEGEGTATATYHFDAAPAIVVTLDPASGNYYLGEEVKVTVTAKNTIGDYGVTYKIGDGEELDYEDGITITSDEEGTVNLTVTVVDGYHDGVATATGAYTFAPRPVATMPVFSLVGGTYGEAQQLTITAEDGATILYSTDGSEPTTEYTNAIALGEGTTTVKAIATLDGYTNSPVATATYIIDIPEELPTITPFKGYYQIKNNGNGMYANIAGRKTLNFTDAPADKAGTVIWLETNDKGQVQSIRSQAADLQGYANRAMRYVPEIVELVADKLNADGEGNLLGETGLKKIMEKFNESFDHHLYVEQAGEGWRLYGKTPSMQPVVDFYRENTAQVEAKLPMLESFINSALNKLKEKIGGQSVFTDFSLLDIWEKMGGTLTKPVDEASIMAFYREVLNNKNYVWDFAYQTAMIYVNNLTSHDRWSEVEEYLGEYAQYIDKIDQIRPDFKYYVVADGNKPDFISEGNKDIINDAARTIWTLEDRSTFTVNIPANAETTCDKFQKATTLYTDFAYKLPEGVTAYKVTDVVEGTAITEALSGVIPAQTPVLLMAAEAGDKVLTLSTEAGTAVTDNLLVGPDYLINTYKLTTPQVEGIFNMIKEKLGEDFYNTYVKEYEHLMYLNSGTVNNKYFWGLKEEDVKKCTYLDEEDVKDYVVRGLEGNAFINNKQVKTNKAFLVSEDAQIISLNKRGDVNHDGKVNIKDVTDLIDRLLDPENTVACPICSDFNLSGKVDIKDVTDLIDVLLTAPYAEQENPSTGSQD